LEAWSVAGGPSAEATIVLVGGLEGDDESSKFVAREMQQYEALKPAMRKFRLIAIPVANPEKHDMKFPPEGVAYRENTESHVLWRWLPFEDADLVLIAGQDFGLANALSDHEVAGVGTIPARVVPLKPGLLKSITNAPAPSEARQELYLRRMRPPAEMAALLAKVYGHDFPQVVYLQGIALIAQMRLGNLAEAQKLAEPYADGTKNALTRPTSLTLAGHLVFAELAERTQDPRYTELVRKAADLGFTETGELKESMPFHEEMSDSFFMALPLLAKAGKLTGERRYFEMIGRHFDFMTKLDLRPDGLYRHSPLTDAAWGRGNAFPALGMALTLSDLPKSDPAYERILLAYRQHMAALARFQDNDGMWREVIDESGSYPETSATSMIGFSMLRGIRNGWLDKAAYQPRVDKAWRGVELRTANDGTLLDVCESTNKQKTVADYLNRAALFEKDPRGGAMALLLAAEMLGKM
jgi:rhamnogalacturonyl hydrolase YesR